jgi:hypothetical protein
MTITTRAPGLIFARSRSHGAWWLLFGSLTFRSLNPFQSRLLAARIHRAGTPVTATDQLAQ